MPYFFFSRHSRKCLLRVKPIPHYILTWHLPQLRFLHSASRLSMKPIQELAPKQKASNVSAKGNNQFLEINSTLISHSSP